nr:uncharacterized protein LOC109956892 isoform X2 [Monopterus albus]
MAPEDILMSKSGRKKHFSFSPFRSRRQTANDRRFCIMWINRMVNKQMEKRMSVLHSEILLMNDSLREEMRAELQEQLRELSVVKTTGERALHHTKLDQELRTTSKQFKKMDECKKNAEEEEGEAKSQDTETLITNFSETPSVINSSFIKRKHLKHEESSKIVSDGFHDNDSYADTSGVSNAVYSSLAPPKYERQEYQRISLASQLMKESQEERPSSSEKEGGAEPPAKEKQTKQDAKGMDTLTKIKRSLHYLFNPHLSSKWEILEDED